MANILTTLFASNEEYLAKRLAEKNDIMAFPAYDRIDYREFVEFTRDGSMLVSGGSDEERSTMLLGMIKNMPESVVILHNGNRYLTPERITRYGKEAVIWDENIYTGMPKLKLLSSLLEDEPDADLVFFYSYALDVCEALHKPMTVQSIYEINWFDIRWMEELKAHCDRIETALDLIHRFDKDMARKAVEGSCRLEKLLRTPGKSGVGLSEGLMCDRAVVKEIYGSSSSMCRQCLELIQAEAEKGRRFTLILDDIYVDVPIIRDNFRNVRLILSGQDITKYDEDMRITNRNCNIVVFNHPSHMSSKKISEAFFGEYDRLYCDRNSGYSSSFFESKTYNRSINIRQGRDARLKPEYISTISEGCAFIRLINGVEGYISFS